MLKANEEAALEGQIISRVKGKGAASSKKKGLGAGLFITAMIVVFLFLFSSGNMIPNAISERLIEETDVQYADAVESKMLVFQQALYDNSVPENTARILESYNVKVVESGDGSAALEYKGRVIAARDFITAVKGDASLYNAFNAATYSRAAYYYDDSAREVFKRIGTSRNNYTSSSEFDEVMDKLVGEGSDITVNNVALVKKTNQETGEKYYEYETVGGDAKSSEAGAMIAAVAGKNRAGDSQTATMNAADQLNKADAISQKQKSELFFLTFMENISKMKAGDGSESKINEAMNYLYQDVSSEVVDVKTGEVVTVSGSMLESPSLYAVLSGEKIDVSRVENYSSDRVLKTVENRIQAGAAGSETLLGSVTSSKNGMKGAIGRFLSGGTAGADAGALSSVTHTIDSSLVNNSFGTIRGVTGGEMLVMGATEVGYDLAQVGGGTDGDEGAIKSYARLTSEILALDAEADRLNRSPFDITSKNTFLGSIVYKMAVAISGNSAVRSGLGQFSAFFQTVGSAIGGLLPTASADDATERYLANFGDCETKGSIGASGSASCASIATFDTSTLNNTFNDPGFVRFVEKNTVLDASGTRTIKKGSKLGNFVTYWVGRVTPSGMTDGGILSALVGGGSSIPFVSDILAMIKIFLGADEGDKRIASGASFVNSASNTEWDEYKYAQRYVALARATENLRAYAGDMTAYSSIRYFEGTENPVIAYLTEYYNTLASQ